MATATEWAQLNASKGLPSGHAQGFRPRGLQLEAEGAPLLGKRSGRGLLAGGARQVARTQRDFGAYVGLCAAHLEFDENILRHTAELTQCLRVDVKMMGSGKEINHCRPLAWMRWTRMIFGMTKRSF